MLEIKPVAAFRDNYIWLAIHPDSRRTAIVDPGDAAPVLAAVRRHRLRPCAILITHHHSDHVGGVHGLLEEFPVPVYGPAAEDIPARSVDLRSGDRIRLDELDSEYEVLGVPGHTLGHIAYHGHGIVFAGDTLFMGGCGRLFEGTAQQMFDSLDCLAGLPDTTQVYCAHEYTQANLRFAAAVEPGNRDVTDRIRAVAAMRSQGVPTVPATVAVEKKTNPFLRARVAAVRDAASQYAGRNILDPVSVFATIRAWKDVF
ncbi:MAG: hydroxyacylglutathione hydrolase [Gammaproteobacteria bacterium]|nr:hydroxyacylglutathione hydrolase [Gammaproteobacteria bacterium]